MRRRVLRSNRFPQNFRFAPELWLRRLRISHQTKAGSMAQKKSDNPALCAIARKGNLRRVHVSSSVSDYQGRALLGATPYPKTLGRWSR